MLNNKHFRMLFIKVMAASFILTLLLATPYISRKAPELLKSLSRQTEDEGIKPLPTANAPTGEGTDELEELMTARKASGKQVKPSFDSRPVEFFPSNQAFALDFHKLPVDYLVPQLPEKTRNGAALIKQLKVADLKAFQEQQEIAGAAKSGISAEVSQSDAAPDGGQQ